MPPVKRAIDCSNELLAASRAEADLVKPSPSEAASVAKLFPKMLSASTMVIDFSLSILNLFYFTRFATSCIIINHIFNLYYLIDNFLNYLVPSKGYELMIA